MICAGERCGEVWTCLESYLEEAAGIALCWIRPAIRQGERRVYRLNRTSIRVDAAIFHEVRPLPIEAARHGEMRILFDPEGRVRPAEYPLEQEREMMGRALYNALMNFELCGTFFRKDLARGRPVQALSSYHNNALLPFIMVLRMAHGNARWDFQLRYVDQDLPVTVLLKVLPLCYPKGTADLEHHYRTISDMMQAARNALEFRGIFPITPAGGTVRIPRAIP